MTNVKVVAKKEADGTLESGDALLKRFKKAVQKANVIKEYKKHMEFLSKTEKRKKKSEEYQKTLKKKKH